MFFFDIADKNAGSLRLKALEGINGYLGGLCLLSADENAGSHTRHKRGKHRQHAGISCHRQQISGNVS